MKTIKISIGLALLCCIIMCMGTAFATSDDTDGTELRVAQPAILEVQLGIQWAGVEFQLKTDAGLYPGTITVGQDGVLRTELGGSDCYILSCLNSGIAAPNTSDIAVHEITDVQSDISASKAKTEAGEANAAQAQDKESTSVGGIPVTHLVLFGGGLLLAVGTLVAVHVIWNQSPAERPRHDFDDGDEDEEY